MSRLTTLGVTFGYGVETEKGVKPTTFKQLELASARLQDTKQSLDRAIAGIRNASQQVKEINEPKKSYGMRFGR